MAPDAHSADPAAVEDRLVPGDCMAETADMNNGCRVRLAGHSVSAPAMIAVIVAILTISCTDEK